MLGRIHLLDQDTSNRIAAGEVVERPASIVKELLENCIDAHSSSVTVEMRSGGIDYIRVTDNGSGIHPDDVENAFLRHATSKIENGHSLSGIETLGFRGEALASIAAVARVEMLTRTEHSDTGVRIRISGGVVEEHTEAGCPEGTNIIVRDLFYNTPARYKFLGKPTAEAGYLSDIVSRIALTSPDVSVKLIRDGAIVFQTPGDGKLEHTIRAIYGKEIADALFSVQAQQDGVHISGYVGTPETAKPNRTFQTVILNGRYIKSSLVSNAVAAALETRIMIHRFPLFVLNLDLDADSVDVNVHPNKLEVRFGNEKLVYDTVFLAVQEGIKQYEMPELYEETPEPEKTFARELPVGSIAEPLPNMEPILSFAPQQNLRFNEVPMPSASVVIDSIPSTLQTLPEQKTIQETILPPKQIDFVQTYEAHIVGQLFTTYIIVQEGETAYFIDQHAAHERLLYDKLIAAAQSKAVQQLLIPYVLNISFGAREVFEELLPQLHELGFEIEPFGNQAFQVRTVPVILGTINLAAFFDAIQANLKGYRSIKSADLMREQLMSMACKAAIKAGQALSQEEMRTLLRLVREEAIPLSCPHGRPIMIRLTAAELEKRFHRVQ